jgi:PAS domain S-box-containing protein
MEHTVIAAQHQPRLSSPLAKKLIVAMAGSSSRLVRLATHPIGAALCLALGYTLLTGLYIVFSNQMVVRSAGSADQLRHSEWLKCGAFVLITGTAFFGFAAFLLKRIAIQQRNLALIFEGVSDCLFLVQIEANESYRFLCANAAFLRVTGFTRDQVIGRRIEEVLPAASHLRVRNKFHEAIREGKTVTWEGSAVFPAGPRVGAVTLTPIANETGTFVQLAGGARDITERKQAEDDVRELSGHLLRSQDEERRRIGRELHDSTAQELVAVAMNLDLVQQHRAGRDAHDDNLLADSQALVEQCQRELRTLAYQLHPPILDEVGLVGAVQEYAAGFTQRSGIKVALDASPALTRLSAGTELALFRVVQESLGNVHRHSGSPTATIRMAQEAGALVLEVSDQGHGLPLRSDGTAANAGVGLPGMRERVRQLGGRFEMESTRAGTTVRAIVPEKTAAE